MDKQEKKAYFFSFFKDSFSPIPVEARDGFGPKKKKFLRSKQA